MKKYNSIIVLMLYTVFLFFTSCKTLEPIKKNDALQNLSSNDLSKLDGDYEIFTKDTFFKTLEYTLTYNSMFSRKNLPTEKDKINLKAINNNTLKATVYKNGKIIKTKIIKGKIEQNFFQYRLQRFSFRLIFNTYGTQNNCIGLLPNGDLYVDTVYGGVLLLVFIPTIGTGSELYGLVFKRKAMHT